jgi:hypothetical protein
MNEGNFLWMLIVVLTAVANLVSILYSLKRKPPVTEELYKDFLAKVDHDAQCNKISSQFEALDNHNTQTHEQIFRLIRLEREWATQRIAETQKAVQEDFKTLERGLGRVEGKLDSRARE